MSGLAYQNFDLLIERIGGQFFAQVTASPAGESSAQPFTVPFTDLELQNFLLTVGVRRNLSVRSGRAAAMQAQIAAFGGKLYAAVVTGEIERRLSRSRAIAGADVDGGLRIRLRLDGQELSDLPWEYLYDPGERSHLCLSEHTPLVRYLPVARLQQPLTVDGPLRILAVIANPADARLDALDVEREWETLSDALAEVIEAGQVRLDRLASPTLAALDARLKRSGPYHVLHFIGHGQFSTDDNQGELLFEDERGRVFPATALTVRTMLDHYRSLRLVVLNSCEGARSGVSDPFAGTAQTLLLGGIPAVVAMQFEISDPAAITFSRAFYRGLADGEPLDTAITTARRAILFTNNHIEWATPVLYTRAADTRIFTVTTAAARDTGQHGEPAITGAEQPGRQESTDAPTPPPAPTEPADAVDSEESEQWAAESDGLPGFEPPVSITLPQDGIAADNGRHVDPSGAEHVNPAPTAEQFAKAVGERATPDVGDARRRAAKRILAVTAAACLLLSTLIQPHDAPQFLEYRLSQYTTPWIWALAATVVLSVVISPLRPRERALALGASAGLAAGLLSMLALFRFEIYGHDDSPDLFALLHPRIDPQVAGALLALGAVLFEPLTRPGRWHRTASWVAAGCAAYAIAMRIYTSVTIEVAVLVLALVVMQRAVRRRRSGEPLPALVFGLAALAVALVATGFSSRPDMSHGDIYASETIVLALMAIFFAEQDRLLLLATRLSCAASLLLTSIVLDGFTASSTEQLKPVWRYLVIAGIAGFASAAAYASRRQPEAADGSGAQLSGTEAHHQIGRDVAARKTTLIRRRRVILIASLSAAVLLAAATTAIILANTGTNGANSSGSSSSSGGGPLLRGAAVSPDGRRLYVATARGLEVIDTATSKAAEMPINMWDGPVGVATSPDGHRIYLTGSTSEDDVTVLDTVTGTLENPIHTGSYATAVAVNATGRLYVAHPDTDQVVAIDPSTGTATGTPIKIAGRPDALALSPDGRRLYVASFNAGVFVIDTATGATLQHDDLAALGFTYGGPVGIAVGSDSLHHVYIAEGNSRHTLALIPSNGTDGIYLPMSGNAIDSITNPEALAVSPKGDRLYVATAAGNVSVVDTATDKPVGTPINIAPSASASSGAT